MATLSTILANVLENPAFAALVVAALGALGTIIGRALVHAWMDFRTRILRQLDATQQAIVGAIADRAVRYAYQTIEGGGQAALDEANAKLDVVRKAVTA